MSGYHERLQGKVRLARIHRIRNLALLALAAVTVFFIASGWLAEGASLKPLYVPLGEAIQIALIMGLVATVLVMYFRNQEIKHASGDSQRFLMAKYSMGRSVWTAGIAIVLAALLFLPMSSRVTGDLLTEPPAPITVPGFSTAYANFTSPDALGLSFVSTLVAYGATWSAGDVRVTLMFGNRTVATGWVNGSARLEIRLGSAAETTFGEWSVVLANTAGGGAGLTLVLVKAVSAVMFGFVPFLLILLAAANLGWWIGLRPIRERTRAAAVYGGGASDPTSGERLYQDYTPPPEWVPPPPQAAPAAPTAPMPSTSADLPPDPPHVPLVPPVLAAAEATVIPRAVKPKVETPESFVTKGEVLVSAGQFDSAIVAFDEALRLSADHVPAILGRAKCLQGLGKRDDAVEAYRRVLKVDRRNEEALRAIPAILVQDRRWREALAAVDESLRNRPHDPDGLERKGDILTSLGRRAEALAAYNAALALDPNDENLKQKIEEVRVDVPGLLSRALIASASGNYGHALHLFDEILEVDPGNVNALIGKAVAYRRSGKSKEALNCLDLVLSIQPGNAAALYNRGQILEADGDLEEALETFDRLVSVSSLDDEAWAAQGDVLTKMGRDDDALRAYAEALKLNPGDEVIQAKVRELQEARALDSDVVRELYKVKGIGPAKAKALLEAGFRAAEDFAHADIEALMMVKGVTKKIAQDLVRHFRKEAVATP